MKKSLVSILIFVLVCAASFSVFASTAFNDTEGHWAETSIERMASEEIVKGNEGLFRPDDNISRIECVIMIARMFNTTEKADLSVYSDVDPDAWYYDELAKAVAMKLIQGYDDGSLRPTAPVSRQEAIVMINRAYQLAKSEDATALDFEDATEIGDWAKSAIEIFVERGFINGYTDGSFRPTAPIKRAELAKILDKSVAKFINKSGKYDLSDVEGIVIVRAKDVEITNYDGEKVLTSNDEVKESLTVNKEEEKKEEDKKPSGGGGGSSSSSSSTVKLNITTDGDVYTFARTEGKDIEAGKKLTITLDGKTLLTGTVSKGNVTTLVGKLDISKIIATLSSEKYNNYEPLRRWGLAIAENLTPEQTSAAVIAAFQATDEADLVSVVYNYLIDNEYITADALKTLAIDTLFDGVTFTDSEIIDILNELSK